MEKINQEVLEKAKNHFFKGLSYMSSEQWIEAEFEFNQSLKYIQDRPSTLINLSATLIKLKKYELAEKLINQTLEKFPENPELILNNALLSFERREFEKALASCDRALEIRPDYTEAWSNRGNALKELKRLDEALASYDRALESRPDYAEAWSNRGNALLELKRLGEALSSYDKAISIKPEFAEAWYNRGNALLGLKRLEEALSSYDKAISIKPEYAEAWSNRGNALNDIGNFSLAEASYREAIRLDPEYLEAHSNLLFSLNYIEGLNPQDVLSEAKTFGMKVSEKAKPKFTTWISHNGLEKLRIGFVSGDLKNHPVGYFLEGLLEKLDKNQFDIFAFPTISITDDLTSRIKPFFNEWVPIYGVSDQEAASLIHQKEIDVLIDLSGHTAHNRLSVFSFKPAPVQVSWLGYFATTGLPEMDYFLGDPQMSPKNEINHFTEKSWSLAETWLCLKPPVHLASVSVLPALKNGFLTFGSFANLSKMNDHVVDTWASVLRRIPASKLLLKSNQLGDPGQIEEVKNRFQKFNVSTERLILEGPESRESYFQAYHRVDIVLDTFPYPGGTTSVDSLWMGVPVLTLKGNRFLSHLGETIAINSGNSDWISSDVDDYVNKAVQFASNFNRLAQLRSVLRERVLNSPLFDTQRFAKNFGDALWGMWNQR